MQDAQTDAAPSARVYVTTRVRVFVVHVYRRMPLC